MSGMRLPAVVEVYGDGTMTVEEWSGMTWGERSKWASNAKRKYWRRVEASEKRESAHELNAQSIACLIEALIEMRPYLPEADV